MKKIISLLLFTLFNITLYGQTIKEKLRYQCSDSSIINSYTAIFDKDGNYLIQKNLSDKVSPLSFISNRQTIKKLYGYAFGKFRSHYDSTYKFKYYLNDDLPFLYGPTNYENWSYFRFPQSNDLKNSAVAFFKGDSIQIYKNEKLFKTIDTLTFSEISTNNRLSRHLESKKNNLNDTDWAIFSENGNCLMDLENNNIHSLYLNDSIVKQSQKSFNNLSINNTKDFIYTYSRKSIPSDSTKFEYLNFAVTKDSIFGPLTYVKNNYLFNHGGYYYNGINYILINNHLYLNIQEPKNIVVLDNKNYSFCFKENSIWKLNVNGKYYVLSYDKISKPTLDSIGNFSLYAWKDSTIFKIVNGESTIFNKTLKNSSFTPIYISPDGKETYISTIGDTTRLYKSDSLIIELKAKKENVLIQEFEPFFCFNQNKEFPNTMNILTYIQINDSAFLNFYDQLQGPIDKVHNCRNIQVKTENHFISGEMFENGYYLLKDNGNSKHTFYSNYFEPINIDGIDKIFGNSIFINSKKITFFGIKNLSLYQYELDIK